MKRVSLVPGSVYGLKVQKVSNYKQNMKAPKLGGGQGIKAPKLLAKALGVSVGMPIHANSISKLLTHPEANVANAARRLMKKL